MQNVTINTASATPSLAHVEIERAGLVTALAYVAKVIERRNTTPILSNVRIDIAPDGVVTLTGTDLDLEAVVTLEAFAHFPGAFTVDCKSLSDVVKSMPAGSVVTLKEAEHTVQVASGRASMRLPTTPVDDFPALAVTTWDHVFDLPAVQVRDDFALMAPAVSTEETRYYLNGIFMHRTADDMRLAATDGHRLHRIVRPAPVGMAYTETGGFPDTILPRKFVGLVGTIIGKAKDGAVSLAVTRQHVRAAFGNVVLTSKLIDGTFPDYARVIPSYNDKALRFGAADFMASVKRVAQIASEKTRAVKLAMSRDKVTVSCTSPENGTASEDCPAEYASEGFDIGFNAKYLADILALGGKAGECTATLADESAPTLFTFDTLPGFLAVLMPMRVDGRVVKAKAAPVPAVEPVETAREAFNRIYTAAWDAKDYAVVRAVCAYFKAWMIEVGGGDVTANRLSADMTAACLSAQRHSTRGAGRKAARAAVKVRGRFAIEFRTIKAAFGEHAERERAIASKAAALAAIGFDAHDPRSVVPVKMKDGKRVFVAKAELAAARYCLALHKADGTYAGRSRRSIPQVYFHNVDSVIYPRGDEGRAIKAAIEAAKVIEHAPMVPDVPAVEAVVPTVAETVTVEAPAVEPIAETVADYAEPMPAPVSSDVTALIEALAARVAGLEAAARGEPVAKARSGVRLLMVRRYLAMRGERTALREARDLAVAAFDCERANVAMLERQLEAGQTNYAHALNEAKSLRQSAELAREEAEAALMDAARLQVRCDALEAHSAASAMLDRRTIAKASELSGGIVLPAVPSQPRKAPAHVEV